MADYITGIRLGDYVITVGDDGMLLANGTPIKTSVSWKYVTVNDDYTASANDFIRIGSGATVTLPDSPVDGARIGIMDINGKATDETFTIDGNGNTIYDEDTFTMNVKYFSEILHYVDDIGWRFENSPVKG